MRRTPAIAPRVDGATDANRRRTLLVALLVIACAAAVPSLRTLALFTDGQQVPSTISAGRIFPGVRTTSGFVVHDASGGGAEADRSSPFARAGDGRSVTSTAWTSAFAVDRYLQFDMNAPLPTGLTASTVAFRFTFASSSATGTACAYVNVRRISDDSSLATYGSAGAPAACVTGVTPATFAISLPIVATSDAANDLRVRVYGRDSAAVGSVVDEAVVTGSSPYATFTLYPVRSTDAASSVPVTAPWELDGP